MFPILTAQDVLGVVRYVCHIQWQNKVSKYAHSFQVLVGRAKPKLSSQSENLSAYAIYIDQKLAGNDCHQGEECKTYPADEALKCGKQLMIR